MPIELTLVPEVRGPLSVYPVASLRSLGVDVFVTDRFGGVSTGPYESLNLGVHVGDDLEAVAENRRRVANAIGATHLIIARQVHGNTVVDARDVTTTTEADAISTTLAGLALATLVADCVPILLVDEESTRFSVVHAGWRGLASGVIGNALAAYPFANAVHAFIGPCISREGYQVGPEVAEQFANVSAGVVPDGGDRSRLDLQAVALHQLRSGGLRDDFIEISTQHTDGGEVFFSDRAARPCGRFALVARRES